MALIEKLTNIADAVRAKTGKTDTMTLDAMVDEECEDEDNTQTLTVLAQSDGQPFKTVDLLNNTLLLLDNPNDKHTADLSSVINLLKKEYKNDQV